jgi:hypothetical protein
MDFTQAVAIVIAGELAPSMVDALMAVSCAVKKPKRVVLLEVPRSRASMEQLELLGVLAHTDHRYKAL